MRYFLVAPASYPATPLVPPAADLPKDSEGRLFFGSSEAGIERMFPNGGLAPLLESGAVQEMTAQQYAELCSQLRK